MENHKREEIIALYDIYGKLLTEKQRNYFEDYYFSDLSISEIAENYSISRNGVFDQLKRVCAILEEYEYKMNLKNKFERLDKLNINEEIKEEVFNILKE